MRRPRMDRAPLPPDQCRRRSRAALVSRTMRLVMHGDSLAAVARREHMPRHATLQRWLEDDAKLRTRCEIARKTHRDLLADELVVLADRAAARAQGRRRAMVERFAIEVRKWRAALAASSKGTRGNERPAHRGISEKAVAMLEQAADRVLPQSAGPAEPAASAEATTGTDEHARTAVDPALDADGETDAPEKNESVQAAPPHAAPESPSSDPPGTWRIRFDVDSPRPAPPYDPLS